MGMDQARHEQQNQHFLINRDGGAIGLTDYPPALNRWIISGLEENTTYHHEQTTAIQTNCFRDVNPLLHVMKQLGNPFSNDSETISTLNIKILMNDSVLDIMRHTAQKYKDAYNLFVEQRFQNNTKISLIQFQDTKTFQYSTLPET